MDYKTAKLLLALPDKFDEHMVKKKYRLMALKYHPDKNGNCVEAKDKFVEINDAYVFLMDYLKVGGSCSAEGIDADYNYMFSLFFKSLFHGNEHSTLILRIIESIAFNYDGFVMNSIGREMLNKLDNDTTVYVYEILTKYQSLLGLSDEALTFIQKMINERIKDDIIIELNPSLNDLMNDNIYVLRHEGEKYYIPLWHSELHYDIIDADTQNKKRLIVVCRHELPTEVEIDDNGDLVIVIRENMENVLINKGINYTLNEETIFIPGEQLRLIKYQNHKKMACGISQVNTSDIYDNSSRGDIHFIIELYS